MPQTRRQLRSQGTGILDKVEDSLHTFSAQAGDALLLIDGEGRVAGANRRACATLGYSRGEMLELSVRDVEPSCTEEAYRELFASLQGEAATVVDSTYRHKDGTTFPVELLIGPIEVDGERHLLCQAHRHSDRQRLQELERLRLATVLESIGEGIIITDQAGDIRYVNPAFERITGYSRSEVIGRNPRILQSGLHGRELYREMWETILAGEVWKGSLVDRRKDGALYDVDSTIAPVLDPDGSHAGFVAISRDVSDHRRSERALQESEERVRAIVETAVDGIITTDENGIVEWCNPATETIFGYACDELVGSSVSILLELAERHPDPESTETTMRRTAERIAGTTLEVVARRRDGTTFPADLSVSEVRLPGRRLFTGIIRDASGRHAQLAAESKLLATRQKLLLARQIQQRFFPQRAPTIAGFDLAGASWPADDTGGDYFDYFRFANGDLGVVVADASGHGVGPALLMSETRAYLRALVTASDDVGELVTRLNLFLCEDCGEERFVTLFLAQIGVGDRSLVHAGAGHQSYLLRRDGEIEVLRATGIPLGFLAREIPGGPRRLLEPGDLVLFLTDGFEETATVDGHELGRERILELVTAHRERPAEEIVHLLHREVCALADGVPQHDDATVVVVKVGAS